MCNSEKYSAGSQFLITAATFVVIIAGIRSAESLLVPFLLALFIAVISAPGLFWLTRKGIPKALALLIVISAIIGAGLLLSVLIGASVDDFSRSLPEYKARLQEETSGIENWLAAKGVALPEEMVRESLNPGLVMQLAGKMFSSLSGVLANAFFILLTAVFILLEASSFPIKLRHAMKDPETTMAHFNHLAQNIKRYVALKSLTSLATGLAVVVWLWIIGVDYPLLWGLLAFILNFVPNIGSIIAAVPAVLLAFVQGGYTLLALAAVGYIVVNIVIGNIIEPRIMGKGLGLSTLVVFLSLVFWGWVLGPIGMLLSVPLTMMVKVALESEEQTHWIAVMLGSESDLEAEVADKPAE
ncbi:MAG: AI-2E family transporter [Gammaproteobacteria bacterium]|nr:MAG: AI-2E family transporter [Gammaproteobacteria bacterium]